MADEEHAGQEDEAPVELVVEGAVAEAEVVAEQPVVEKAAAAEADAPVAEEEAHTDPDPVA